jgi:hypothetical protein
MRHPPLKQPLRQHRWSKWLKWQTLQKLHQPRQWPLQRSRQLPSQLKQSQQWQRRHRSPTTSPRLPPKPPLSWQRRSHRLLRQLKWLLRQLKWQLPHQWLQRRSPQSQLRQHLLLKHR